MMNASSRVQTQLSMQDITCRRFQQTSLTLTQPTHTCTSGVFNKLPRLVNHTCPHYHSNQPMFSYMQVSSRLVWRILVQPLIRWVLQYRVNKCVLNSLWKLSLLTLGSLILPGNEFQAIGPATEKARRPYICNQCRGRTWHIEWLIWDAVKKRRQRLEGRGQPSTMTMQTTVHHDTDHARD